MGARSAGAILFRIVYSSLYTILLILLILLLAVTPGDHIYQTVRNDKFGNVFVVGGTYVVTAIIAFFIYASRLYTNRTALLAIPKPYLPIEEGELGKKVRKMIVKNRERSALIAWESRPKTLDGREMVYEESEENDHEQRQSAKLKKTTTASSNGILDIDPSRPPWGEIVHRGWSSPASTQVPNLHFDTVVAELPNLIEAKAVSIAPPDPAFDFLAPSNDQAPLQPPPDPQIVALLQHPPHMSLRDYIEYLAHLGLHEHDSCTPLFLTRYEHARFSTVPLTEDQFLDLMAAFSDVLARMQVPDTEALERALSAPSKRESTTSGSTMASAASVLHHRVEEPRSSTSSSSSLRSQGSVIHNDID